ncbi:MAG: hypothetical protein JKX94_02520, partial [Sneathiella sp.]|nr:hypothetical protein [Sneathiella sp.]
MINPYANAYYPNQPVPVAQLAPQGIFGDILGAVAPIAGQVIGGAIGQPQIGTAIGQAAGQLGGLIPFSAGPTMGHTAVQPMLPPTIPYGYAPQGFAPQGLFGDILGAVAPIAGQVIGGALGQPQIGSAVGGLAGQLGGLIPFSAGPTPGFPPWIPPTPFPFGPVVQPPFPIGVAPQTQLAPQGLFGDIFSKVAPVAGSAIGSAFGNQQLGASIGNVAGQIGSLLPFSAGPGQLAVPVPGYPPLLTHPQLAPQGLFGDIFSKVAPVLGSTIGGALGHQQLGSSIGNLAGQLGGLIPFSAGPGQFAAPVPGYPPLLTHPQLAPQGLFGDIFKTVAPIAGQVIGGALGQPQIGSAVGGLAGQLGGLIPFSAGP